MNDRTYKHLLGRQFEFGTTDCFSLVRDFYIDNFGIRLPNVARPNEFWRHGMDMYAERYAKHGFEVLDCHPSQWQYGDVILMAVRAELGNHAGVLVENGNFIHHLWGRFSTEEKYIGPWRNLTLCVVRHRDVRLENRAVEADIADYVSAKVRRDLESIAREV